MARFARVVAPDLPHHVTQRGNYRQDVFFSDADRQTYLTWLKKYSTIHRLRIAGYCLMTNHVHLIVVPEQADSIARALRRAHARYALYVHAKRGHTGHLWQNRYYSTVMDETHLAAAMRYVETNPIRAGMVEDATHYRWASAAAHTGGLDVDNVLDLPYWRARYTSAEWRAELQRPDSEEFAEQIRANTNSGRPLGAEDFIGALEQRLGRPLKPARRGRKRKSHHETLSEIALVATEIGD
jgi:putative transposase